MKNYFFLFLIGLDRPITIERDYIRFLSVDDKRMVEFSSSGYVTYRYPLDWIAKITRTDCNRFDVVYDYSVPFPEVGYEI